MSDLAQRMSAWEPEGITLEPAALEAAKSMTHKLVVAGPGAGKTELLAQRACFLLQTGACPPPYRILAISFKREAAENLKNRVILRCGRDLASRFDSMTYDAFAKDLLDRFRLALDPAYRPSGDYQIATGREVKEEGFRQAMMALTSAQCPLNTAQRQQIGAKALLFNGILGRSLPFDGWPNDIVHVAGMALWKAMLAEQPSRLSFPMIGRLATLLVRKNTAVKNALQQTYRFVFLDEFQDTTEVQFVLTGTCFYKSAAVLTAVGDSKQRIMGWAGALTGIFKKFVDTFGATVAVLTQNHRSRSRLVQIQSVFAKELDPDAVQTVTARSGEETGECQVLEFSGVADEASYLADLIELAVKNDQIPPEEICVLCRARPDDFADALHSGLRERGIKVRVEVNRETINEPVSQLLLDMLTVAFSESAPEAWERASAAKSQLGGDRNDAESARTMQRLLSFLDDLRRRIPPVTADAEAIERVLNECLDFMGRDSFAASHPQYAHGNYLQTVVSGLADIIAAELPQSGWENIADATRGVGAVSIMTMHKSKGLEFHTVIFLGLEDQSLWSYSENKDEETCGLFVALSRAKERCIFTFCRSRPGKYGDEAKSRITIKRVFDLFEQAGVTVDKFS